MNPGLTVHLAEAPYLGLRPFEVDEADIFFGRERQTDELLRRLSQTYFLPIVGPSGCGKSSLVRAGLLASLESGFIVEAGGRWRILAMMPRDRPIEELANAILRRLSDPDESKLIALQAVLRSGPRGLIEALKEISTVPGENLLLLVDQFEEIFRFRDQLAPPDSVNGATSQDQRRKDEADAFVGLLLETAKEKAAYVVLTMRSDFLRDCSFFSGLPEAFNKSIYLTPRLDRDDLQSAIQEPARVLGGSLQPELVRQLINDAGNNQDQLPLMQHVLMRMWSDVLQKRPNEPVELTLNDYVSVGELSKALCKDAEDAFEKELTPEQQRIAEVMFKALCVRGSSDRDTRAPARVDHVAKIAGVKWEEVVPVVDVFRGADRYFLTPRTGPLSPDTVLDITHESLIRNWARLSEWVEEEALSVETYQRLVRDAVDWKSGGDLLSPIRLSSVIAWEKRSHPTEAWSQRYDGQFALAMEYLQASRKQREKEAHEAALVQQRLFLKENAVKVLGTVLVIALGVVGWAIYQMHKANANYGSALEIKAKLEWHSQKTLSAWPYAVAAPLYNRLIKLDELSDKKTQPFIQYFRQIPHRAQVTALAISREGTSLAAALSDGSIDIVNPQTGKVERNLPALEDKTPTAQLAFSPIEDLLYCLGDNQTLQLRRLSDGTLLPLPEAVNGKAITSFAFDATGGLALWSVDGTLILRRWDSPEFRTVPPQEAEDFSMRSAGQRPGQQSVAGPKGTLPRIGPSQSKAGVASLSMTADGSTVAGVDGEGSLHVWRIDNSHSREERLDQNFPSGVQIAFFARDDFLTLGFKGGRIALAGMIWQPPRRKNSISPAISETPTSKENAALAASKATGAKADQAPQMDLVPESSTKPRLSLLIGPSVSTAGMEETELSNLSETARAKNFQSWDAQVRGACDPSGEMVYWLAGDNYLRAMSAEIPVLEGARSTQQFPRLVVKALVNAHKERATAVAVSPGGSWLATGGTDHATRIWRIEAESLSRAPEKILPPIRAMAIDPRGKIVAIGSDSFGTRIWRDDAIKPFRGLEPEETALWLSDDGKSVVVSSGKTVRIIDTATFQPRARITGAKLEHWGFNGPILAAMESDDDTHLTVALWDASTGEKLGRIPAAKSKIVDVMFGSAGRDLVAIATDKNRLTLWDIHDPAQPREAKSMSTGEAEINFISFAAAKNRVAAASSNKVILFDAKTTAQVAIPVPEPPTAMIFNAKASLLAIAFKSGLVKLWDCEKSKEQTEIRGSAESLALAVTSGEEIVTAGMDGVIRVWDLAGQLVKTFPSSEWRPKSAEDAARLSGLVLKDLDVRFLKLEEEQALKIDASLPRDEEMLADFWRDAWMTRRNFAALENLPELNPVEVQQTDLLEKWLSTDRESSPDPAIRARFKIANHLRDELRLKLARKHGNRGTKALYLGQRDRALAIFDRVLKIIPPRDAGEYYAWRGFVRHLSGDEQGATEDRKAALGSDSPTSARALDFTLNRREPSSEQSLLIGSFLTWLEQDYAKGYRYKAQANFALKHYGEALADVNEALRLQGTSVAKPEPASGSMTLTVASLLLLRGQVLEAQHSPEARKDFQQLVDRLVAAGISDETKAFAQLHLGKFDPANFGAAKDYFAEQTRRYPERSLPYYNLACFFAIHSASSGADENARTNDVTAAIDALQKGVTRAQYFSLRRFVDKTPDLLPLENDPRFTAILEKDERAHQTSASGDSE